MKKVFFIASVGFAVAAILTNVWFGRRAISKSSYIEPSPSESISRAANQPEEPKAVVSNSVSKATEKPNIDMESQLVAIDREIEDHERFLYKENAIRRLNDGTASPEDRNLYFDVMEKLARARARKIDLRIQRIQAQIEQAGAGQ